MRRVRAAGLAALLVVPASLAAMLSASPAQAEPVICEESGSSTILDSTYIVQNNAMGADTQCIDVDQDGGFTVARADHDQAADGPPAAYPSIYRGCHRGACSAETLMPIPYREIGAALSSISMTYPDSGSWSAAYDIWLDPTARTDGQNGLEVMIWLNRQGPVRPVGAPVGTVSIDGVDWEVWHGDRGSPVVTYLSPTAITSHDLNIRFYLLDAVRRGYLDDSWYLTSIQAGFQLWSGGASLAVDSFTASVHHVSEHPPPPIPPPLPARSCTATTSVPGQGHHGYLLQVTVTNSGTTPIDGWTVGFTLPDGHRIRSAWNAHLSADSGSIEAANLSHNGALDPGESTRLGFLASRSGGAAPPTELSCSAA